VGIDRHHACRLADDGDAGRHTGSLEKSRHSLRAETAKLLVKGEGEIERLAEFAGTGMNSGAMASAMARNPFISTAPRP
jgi:hypothetical protein